MSQMMDLGNVMGSYTLSDQDKIDIAKEVVNGRDWESAVNAVINRRLDSVPTQGSTNLMTSGAIYNAFSTYTPNKTFVNLSAPLSLAPPALNTELYYTNGGQEANKLSITLPAIAEEGAVFSLEFRSTGSEEVAAVIDAFEVESGGKLLTHGELAENAYATKITAVYSTGIWLASIVTFEPSGGIPQTVIGSIVYSGANRAYFAALSSPSITRAAIVGENRLESAASLTPGGSNYNFSSIYGMTFKEWNTEQDGSGDSYSDMAIVEVEDGNTPLTLYPQYNPREILRGTLAMSNEFSLNDERGNVNKTKTLTVSLEGSGIADYAELTLKVKVVGSIYCHNNGHGAYIQVAGSTIVRRDTKGGSTGESDWILLTRNSASDSFTIDVTCRSSTGDTKTHSDYSFKIAAIRIE